MAIVRNSVGKLEFAQALKRVKLVIIIL